MSIFLIVGMHRSGTSCLAGSLEQLGLDFHGCGQGGTDANARGNRENRELMIFHETILKSLGGSWREPPEEVVWQSHHYPRAKELLESYQTPFSAFKCPRTLLHWRQWLELIPEIKVAAIVRHPLAVAKSLQARDQITLAEGLALWLRYNRELLALDQAIPVAWFNFDWQPARFAEQLTAKANDWQLPQADNCTTFRLDELKRHEAAGELPPEVEELYRKLLAKMPY